MTTGAGSTNRLARESSPYLRLHAHNPVDWFPWGAEAIDKARAEDKPIFLSVGYSTCYWCHVMERESFSDPSVAAEMNRLFVNIKVDREERPDLDEIYMIATQILSGQGGWPNSVFLTPQLVPFFAGTYFPPRDAHGRPGFGTVLHSLDHAWRDRREDVESQSKEIGEAIRHHLEEIDPVEGELPGGEPLERALAGLRQRFDPTWGGFGQQPKFPTPSNLWLLEEALGRSEKAGAAAMMLSTTLDQMARGGIFDQLAGGFHRYATDREWKIPHFEKMLYDNGLLLELYSREHARTGSAETRRIVEETAAWLAREMTSPEGAFWSAIDAETDGHEGAYYVWTRVELEAALGAEDAIFAAPLLGFDGDPFFEEQAYVLHLPRPLDVQARSRRSSREALLAELDPIRVRLLAARGRRKRPATDDKILADWNGTAIAGLAEAGRCLDRPDLTESAARAAEFVLAKLRAPNGDLLHAWRAGEGRIPAFLSDYVFLGNGLQRLHGATGDKRWLERAIALQAEQDRRLASPKGGYFNAQESFDLLFRSKEVFDGAMPAANGVAATNLLALHAATGERRFLDSAESTLRAFAPIVRTHADGARTMCVAFARFETAKNGGKTFGAKEDNKPGQRPAPISPAAAASPLSDEAKTSIEGRVRNEGQGDPSKSARGVSSLPSYSPSTEASPQLSSIFLEPPVLEWGALEGGEQEFVFRCRLRDDWHLAVAEERSVPALGAVGGEIVELSWPVPVSLESPVAEGPAGAMPALRALVGEVEAHGRLRRDAPRVALLFRFEACGDGRCLPIQEIEVGSA